MPRNLDALGIDVDDRREAGAAHRGRGGREQRRRTGRERAWAIGLADELSAVAAAQPQQRRRAEQLELGQPRFQLLESAGRVGELRPGDEDADEVAERRVPERATALEAPGGEAGGMVAAGGPDRRR